jgi:hypothetical protein
MNRTWLWLLLGCAGLSILVIRSRSSAVSPSPSADVEQTSTESTSAQSSVAPPRARSSRSHAPLSRALAPQTVTPSPRPRASVVSDGEGNRPVELSPLRAPVIDAIRGASRGEQKRREMVDAIRRSGESDEPWTAEAEVAFETWTEAMPKEQRKQLQIAEPVCYAAGCIADVTFPDATSHRAASEAFRKLTESNAGHGGRVQTPPEVQGSKLVTSWFMLRPNDS